MSDATLPSIQVDGWDEWTRVYNDPSVWRPLIDAICAREGIGYRQLRAASANTNAVFLLDRAYALKIYSPFWTSSSLSGRCSKRSTIMRRSPFPMSWDTDTLRTVVEAPGLT